MRMFLVGHGYDGFGVGVQMKVVDGMHAGQSQEGWSYVWLCLSTLQVQSENTDDFWSHCLPGAQLMVGSSWNWSVFLGRP